MVFVSLLDTGTLAPLEQSRSRSQEASVPECNSGGRAVLRELMSYGVDTPEAAIRETGFRELVPTASVAKARASVATVFDVAVSDAAVSDAAVSAAVLAGAVLRVDGREGTLAPVRRGSMKSNVATRSPRWPELEDRGARSGARWARSAQGQECSKNVAI